jgi:hypothetical protein
MVDPELNELLEQLHSEIENTETVDEKGQELLRDIGTDIRDLLERSEGSHMQVRASTIQNLEDSIEYLEITHPTLTTILSRVLEILGGAGV